MGYWREGYSKNLSLGCKELRSVLGPGDGVYKRWEALSETFAQGCVLTGEKNGLGGVLGMGTLLAGRSV